MKRKYSIHMMSKIFGIPKSTLRYWESERLIRMNRNDENNYREYSISTMFEIIDIITYRMMNIPIKEIRSITSGTQENMRTLLEQKGEEIEVQIAQLMRTQEIIKRKQRHFEEYDKLLKEPYKKGMPKPRRLVPFIFEEKAYWEHCQDDCANFAVYMDGKTLEPCYALVAEEEITATQVLWEKEKSESTFVECILKVSFDDIRDNNIKEHLTYLHHQGMETGCIIAQLLFTANEEKCYDYYCAWIEIFPTNNYIEK